MENFFFESIMSNQDATKLSHRDNKIVRCVTHFHRQMEIVVVKEGVLTANLNGEHYSLKAGDVIIAEPFDLHTWGNEVGQYVCMIIPYSKLNHYISVKAGRVLKNKVISDSTFYEKLTGIIDSLYLYYDTSKSDDSYIIDCLMKAIVGVIVEYVTFGEKANKNKGELLQDILSWLDNNYKSNISLEVVAKHFGFSEYYFSKLFNRHVGMNLNAYVNMLRTKNVIRLIRDEKAPVSDAILDSGYSSLTPFYRYFKENYGMSVKEYLKK